ncbi:MAG: helix-turn-helix domain-containing GNAT family N-acetyltransferase [Edaphobacter sp.]|uniref:bifunctional helix-turn-helix transcriptional regulator/GNAT family N-acetyltransferase n=1 Tax=Edaphobacter sp. TaxID=1934404 RepID=UPI002381F62B|nr:helix-turn-helix domain-containing GNAT family N-acetyltransferase [Edaphobacter sp.]MDE1176722.1 helix-turn-helix domain-containing GNAT family N-acetyltransferase [Edaphobacter sp.]
MKSEITPSAQVIKRVRSFNRFYTREIGLLTEHMPGSALTLAEARVLYELAQDGEQTAADLVRALVMDKAHVSRIVARHTHAGLVKSRISPQHGKHKLLSLTAAGKKAFKELNNGTESQIKTLLSTLSVEDCDRLAKHMQEIQRMLEGSVPSREDVVFRPLKPGDIGWITHRQAVLYAQEHGWDGTFEGLVSEILGDFVKNFDPSREDAWVAELRGEIVGSVFLVKSEDRQVAKLRLLYVDPMARGLGIGSRLVQLCIERARAFGYNTMTLWTHDILVPARKIYGAAGFTLRETNRYRLFGKDLTGETWTLDLVQR